MKAEDLKLIVKDKYGQIPSQSILQSEFSCCGTSGCYSTKSVDTGTFSITVAGHKN
jgi:hypothetical protein